MMVPSLSYTPNYHSAANYRTGSGSDRTQLSTPLIAKASKPQITEPGAVATALNSQHHSSPKSASRKLQNRER